MQSFISATDIEILTSRQSMIADDIINQEYEYEEDVSAAERDYFHGINFLYAELGTDAPCKLIDPLLFYRYKEINHNADEKLSRKDVLIKLGKAH